MATDTQQNEDVIEIKDIGAIEYAQIPIKKSGFIVLRGDHGKGKSTALNAVRAALGGKTDRLPVRDNCKRGTISIGSAVLSVTAGQSRKKGMDELVVESIESDFDISKLVDPGILDKEKADSHRLKQLVHVAGVEANPSDYYELAGGKESFDALAIDTDTNDPILLADRVKRAFEKESREFSKLSETCEANAKAKEELAKDCEILEPVDVEELRTKYDQASEELTKLVTIQQQAEDNRERIEQAKQKIQEIESKHSVSVDDAKKDLDVKKSILKGITEKIQQLEKEQDEMIVEVRAAEEKHQTAERYEESLKTLRETVESTVSESPTDAQLQNALEAKTQAMHAIERAGSQNTAFEYQQKYRKEKEYAKIHRKKAESLRDKAKSVEGVLTSLIPDGPLRVEGGRLVLETDRSKHELYGDLSDGERWNVAIDIAANFLSKVDKPQRMLVIPQPAYEGMRPSLRPEIEKKLNDVGVKILTAIVDDGELRVEAS